MGRGDLSCGRGERIALLLVLLAEQERHGAGCAALRSLRWQQVPVTHAFGLHGGGQRVPMLTGCFWGSHGREMSSADRGWGGGSACEACEALQVGVNARWRMCACLEGANKTRNGVWPGYGGVRDRNVWRSADGGRGTVLGGSETGQQR